MAAVTACVASSSVRPAPFSAARVARRYSLATYLRRYRRALARLERGGYVRRVDRRAMIAAAAADYRAARR